MEADGGLASAERWKGIWKTTGCEQSATRWWPTIFPGEILKEVFNCFTILLTCKAHCCPPDPLSPNGPSRLRSHGFWETFSEAAQFAAWSPQGQSCCCCRAAGEASPQQQWRWSSKRSAESSADVSWGASQPGTNGSPHSTENTKDRSAPTESGVVAKSCS